MKFFEDFQIGEKIVTRARTVTEADVVNFCGLSGDFYPLHSDLEYAKKSMFGQRIAHGFLVLSLASGLLPLYDLAIQAFYGMDRVRFTAPTFIHDTIFCELTVIEKEDKGEKGGIIAFHQEIKNQRGEVACHLITKILVKKRET